MKGAWTLEVILAINLKAGIHEVMIADSDSAGPRRGKCKIIWKKKQKKVKTIFKIINSIRFQMKKVKLKIRKIR